MTTYYVHELFDQKGHRLVGKLRADAADPVSLLDRARKKYPKIKNIFVSINARLKRFNTRTMYGAMILRSDMYEAFYHG